MDFVEKLVFGTLPQEYENSGWWEWVLRSDVWWSFGSQLGICLVAKRLDTDISRNAF